MTGTLKELEQLLKNEIVKILKDKFDPILIYIFGSYAKGELREDSDIDIAFLSEKQYSAYEVFMLAQELADILKRDVDLVDLSDSSTVFKAQVVGKGIIIYSKDERRRIEFQVRTLKEYAILNEDRQIVLDNIKKRGSVYGR